MKVKYLPYNINKDKSFSLDEISYSKYLEIDKEYTVYGIEYLSNGDIKFMIGDDITPNLYLNTFFKIIDNRISKYWVGVNENYYPLLEHKTPSFISFKEATEDYFFDKLLDGNHPKTVELYWKYIELMNNEFPDYNLKNATIVDKNWLMCSYCNDIWEATPLQGVVVCPKHSHRNNNPLWVGIPNELSF